jgi:outer membrane protein assembly factor BamD (BamD/ComL family)
MRTLHRLIRTTIFVSAALVCTGCPSRVARQQLSTAQTALEQKRYDEAMAAADRYLKDDAKGLGAPAALYFKGRALEQRVKRDDAQFVRDLTAAKANYVQALQLNPSRDLQAYIQTSFGNVTYWLHDYATAEASFQNAHELLPAGDLKGWALYRLGLSQQRQGRWADADKTFVAVQNQFPGTEISRRSREHQGARAFYVQVAAFQNLTNAENLVASLRTQGVPSHRLHKPERNLHLVMAGPAKTYSEAIGMRRRLSSRFNDAMIVP